MLWENASPTSAFAEQSLTFPGMENLQDGDLIVVETTNGVFTNSWSPTESRWCYDMSLVGYDSSLSATTGHYRQFVVRP